jgi:hypothetical protein
MKKIILLCCICCISILAKAQNNAIGANDNFMDLLIQMGPELRAPKNIGSWPMLQNLDVPIDNTNYKYYLVHKLSEKM